MAALTEGRMTPRRSGDVMAGLVAAAAKIFVGAMVMRDGDGHLVPGQTATGLIGVGVAEVTVDNTDGGDGDQSLRFRADTFRFENSAAADEIATADIGALCYAVDDQTVAKTDGTGTRSPAGIIADVDTQGVWVRFDAALTAAS